LLFFVFLCLFPLHHNHYIRLSHFLTIHVEDTRMNTEPCLT
jgi:hypothetical protein